MIKIEYNTAHQTPTINETESRQNKILPLLNLPPIFSQQEKNQVQEEEEKERHGNKQQEPWL